LAIHPGTAAVEQDRPASAGAGRPVDGPPDRWRQWNQDDLGPFAAHTQHAVAVLFAQVGDVGRCGIEDPQAQEAEHSYQGEVAGIGGLPGRGQQGLELEVGESEGG
jgi:hypothetical protein